jgi:MoaA/NifB/PqqE/SkfB family radical SAM enzyme
MSILSPLYNLACNIQEAARWAREVRAYNPSARRTRLRGPASVQIQTIDRCNAACIMCPYSSMGKTSPANLMDDALYIEILEELRRAGTVRNLALMLQNEPLLDRRFSDRVQIARKLLGRRVFIRTVTNGEPLTKSMINCLGASDIDHVSVSIDAIRKDTFERIRYGLNYRRVVENTLLLSERLGRHRVSVRFLRQRENAEEEQDFSRFWQSRGVRVRFIEPTNRAGSLKSYERVKKPHPRLWKKLAYPVLNRFVPACPYPFTSINIFSDGRAILCCNDWGPRDTVGDLSRKPLKDVWNGDKINHYRHLLWMRQAEESLVCADCSLSDRYWKI